MSYAWTAIRKAGAGRPSLRWLVGFQTAMSCAAAAAFMLAATRDEHSAGPVVLWWLSTRELATLGSGLAGLSVLAWLTLYLGPVFAEYRWLSETGLSLPERCRADGLTAKLAATSSGQWILLGLAAPPGTGPAHTVLVVIWCGGFVTLTAVAWTCARRGRRRRAGIARWLRAGVPACFDCAYPLRGGAPWRCPECGRVWESVYQNWTQHK